MLEEVYSTDTASSLTHNFESSSPNRVAASSGSQELRALPNLSPKAETLFRGRPSHISDSLSPQKTRPKHFTSITASHASLATENNNRCMDAQVVRQKANTTSCLMSGSSPKQARAAHTSRWPGRLASTQAVQGVWPSTPELEMLNRKSRSSTSGSFFDAGRGQLPEQVWDKYAHVFNPTIGQILYVKVRLDFFYSFFYILLNVTNCSSSSAL
ncbi:unnamed protein product [Protopolystoma xenopodis]|uniref:Uncharacterized protein n=1 Tax=Protopolystoma xenopodis TaxID=117903 RepID=A0A3S5FEI4_9PLAT|nr:unnamed protein product [Protopolystoma xenopodis]